MKLYNATATLDQVYAAVSDEETLDIVEALDGYHPAVGSCPVGRTTIVVSFPAENLRQAVSTALLLLERFTPIGIDVLPTDLFDQRAEAVKVPELLSVTEAADRLGVTRQAVLNRLETGSLSGQRVGKTWVLPATHVTPTARAARATDG